MKSGWKILLVNLAVLIGYSIWVRIATRHEELGILLLSMVLIIAHVVINMIIGGIFYGIGNRERGRDFMFSALGVLLIGFGVCWGNASI